MTLAKARERVEAELADQLRLAMTCTKCGRMELNGGTAAEASGVSRRTFYRALNGEAVSRRTWQRLAEWIAKRAASQGGQR